MMTEDELKQEAEKWLKDNIRTEKKDGMIFNIVPTPVQIYCAGAELREKQLTKAKEHIKKLLDCLRQDTNDPQTNYYVCQYMDRAEQFLKEVDK